MIEAVAFWKAVCDNCGAAHEGPDGIEAWSDENGAMEMATGSDWLDGGDGLLYCDACRSDFEDDQDETPSWAIDAQQDEREVRESLSETLNAALLEIADGFDAAGRDE